MSHAHSIDPVITHTPLERLTPLRVTRTMWLLFLSWTLLILALFLWHGVGHRKDVEQMAMTQTRIAVEKDLLYRQWSASHGGVYVPVTERTQPNPLLASVAERDIETPSGRKLTLLTQEQMRRQVAELERNSSHVYSQLVGIHPLDPANTADEWEKSALDQLRGGAEEVSGPGCIEGKSHMRLMRPIYFDQSCLTCHHTKNLEGALAGGLSAAVPSAPMKHIIRDHIKESAASYSLLWLSGIGLIYGGMRPLRRSIVRRAAVENTLEVMHYAMDNAGEAIFCIGPDGRFTYVNHAAVHILGYTREELVQMHVAAIDPNYSEENWTDNWNSVHNAGRLVFESRHISKSGATIPVEISVMYSQTGGNEFLLAIARDIGERKQSTQNLRASEERYRALFNGMIAGYALVEILIDDNGAVYDCRYIQINPAFEQLTGLTAEMVIGKTIREVLPEVEPLWIDVYGQVMKTGRPLHVEDYIKPLDRWFDVMAFPIGGPLVGVTFTDSTERRRAEGQLRLLATAFEHALESVMITDASGVIQYVNPSFLQNTGYLREEVIGQNPRILKSDKHDDAFYRSLWETINQGKIWKGRITNKCKNGKLYTVDTAIAPIFEAGNITHFVAVRRDVSRESQLEQQLRQAQKLEAIGVLAGGIAHDFNNILSAILGYTELALNSTADLPGIRHDLEQVMRAGKRARDLVQQILTFSREREMELQPIRLQPIIKEALKLLRATLPATIEFRECVNAPGLVLADATQIHQVVMNLCTNAAHAIGDVGGVLEVAFNKVEIDAMSSRVAGELPPGVYACLSVSDTGRGMDAQTIERIFDPFFTTKRETGGTGLGLSTVHGIVKSHGGAMTVYSEPGKGTVFHMYMPLVVQEGRSETDDAVPVRLGQGEHVLVVDDEQELADLVARMLEMLGYRATVRTSPIEALNAFKAEPSKYDVMITDQTMPKLTGLQLAQRVRKIRPNMPVLVATGFSSNIVEHAAACGISGILMKPLLLHNLAEAVRAALRQSPN